MLAFVIWYIAITLFGLAAVPLAWTWLRWLPDRGWGVARPLGLLLAGWLVWFLGSFGMAEVGRGSAIGSLLLIALGSLLALQRWGGGWSALREWVRANRGVVLAQEALFLVALALWAYVRAHDNSISATEKPMELAFLNAIVRGGNVPPPDPWLSGYAISYYYFGYLIVGLLTTLTGIQTAITFNLAVAMLFGLAVLGIFSVVYNLLAAWWGREGQGVAPRGLLVAALLGPLFLVGISNLTGMAEITNANGMGSADFYRWLDVRNFPAGERPAEGWHPDTNWWWWRASRTVRDRVPGTDQDAEVIDEFPFFSFLLGDMHPHVLALPFGMLALSMAFNLLRGAVVAPGRDAPLAQWRGFLVPAWTRGESGWGPIAFGLNALVIGGLYFMNSWDWPTYTFLFGVAWGMGIWLRRGRLDREVAIEMGLTLFGMVLLSLLLYLPFHIGFRSQASGLGFVHPATKTSLRHYLLMFGLFYLVLVPLLAAQLPPLVRAVRAGTRTWGSLALAGVPLVVAAVGLGFGWWTVFLTGLTVATAWMILAHWLGQSGERAEQVVSEAGGRQRPAIAGGSGTVAPQLALGVEPALLFVVLLCSVAALLTLGTEFVFIRDTFGSRMNSVFKLWYQAWTLLAVAAAFGVVWLARRLPLALRVPWGALLVALLFGSMLYPIGATMSKANSFRGTPDLNGLAWFASGWPDDFAAIEWLKANVAGQPVILEATGGQYSEYARVSIQTGLPTLLGWGGHELQWRGNYDEAGQREPAIASLYQTVDPVEARRLLDEYNVEYVYIGDLERRTYNLSPQQIDKFRFLMTPVYQQGSVIIFGR